MKRKLILAMLVAASFGIAAGCKKDNPDDNTTATATKGSMSAKLSGNTWQATESSLQHTLLKTTDGSGNDGKRFDIRGTSSDGKRIIVTIQDYSTGKQGDGVAVRTYSFGDGTDEDALFTYSVGNSTMHMPLTGKVIFSSVDASKKTASGSFEFTAKDGMTGDTLVVTDGLFKDIKYSVMQ